MAMCVCAVAAEAKASSPLAKKAKRLKERKTLLVGVRSLLGSRSFQAVTFACALNDVGSWALVSVQLPSYLTPLWLQCTGQHPPLCLDL